MDTGRVSCFEPSIATIMIQSHNSNIIIFICILDRIVLNKQNTAP